MKQVRFEESEVPYQTLARFGLTQEKIEDLPLWALEDIGQGRRSPLLPIQVTNDEGETLKSRTRFALVRILLRNSRRTCWLERLSLPT